MMGSTHLTGMTELPPKPTVSTYSGCKADLIKFSTNEGILPPKSNSLHHTGKKNMLSSLSRENALYLARKRDSMNGHGQSAPAIQDVTWFEMPCRPFPDTSIRVPRALSCPCM